MRGNHGNINEQQVEMAERVKVLDRRDTRLVECDTQLPVKKYSGAAIQGLTRKYEEDEVTKAIKCQHTQLVYA